MRAVTYLRFSCKDQADGYSIDAQRHATHTFIQARNWQLINDYVDEAFSAKADSERPSFERLLADARQQQFDIIVVDKVDRFYRHLQGLLSTLEELQQYHVTLVSVKENLDFTTPWGKIALTILGILAEIYIDNLRQETRKGKLARARNGKWNGTIPLGYCRGACAVCADPNGPGYCPHVGQPNQAGEDELIIHPIEAEAVKLAFELYATGNYSFADVAQRLNRTSTQALNGKLIPFRTKGKPGRQPGPFSADAVRTAITRRFYTGVIPYYGIDEEGQKRRRDDAREWYPGQHPPIIDEELFERAQQIRRQTSQRYRNDDGTNPITAHPLSGLLVCVFCGQRFRAMSARGGARYYRDVSRIERTHECNQPTLKAEEIEPQIEAFMRRYQRRLPANWRERLEALWATENPQLARLVEQKKGRLDRAVELYLDGLIPQHQVQECRLAYQLLLGQLRPRNMDAIMQAGESLERFDSLWAEASLTQKNELLRLVIEAAHIRTKSLLGIQLTVASLPIVAICRSGSDGSRFNSDKILIT